jgi:hypothetical protein
LPVFNKCHLGSNLCIRLGHTFALIRTWSMMSHHGSSGMLLCTHTPCRPLACPVVTFAYCVQYCTVAVNCVTATVFIHSL